MTPPTPPAVVAPLVVRAARLPPPAGDPAFSILRIDPAQLAAAPRLDEALRSAPGFSLFRRISSLGANPTTQGVSLRAIAGSAASRALVTLDGVPQNDPFGGWVIWTGLPSEALSGASLVRGAGAGPYGAGALTGAVALEQPSHVDGHAAGEVEAGERGYWRAAGITEVDTGPARVFLDASDEESRGWIPVIHGRGRADRPLALRDWSAAERIELDLGRALLSERIGGYEERRGGGTLYANSRARGIQGSLTLVAPPEAGRLGWRAQAWLEASDLANTSATVTTDRNSATPANDQYATPATGAGANLAVRRSEAGYSWEVGLDVRDFDGESREHLYTQGKPSGARVSGGGELVAGAYGEYTRILGRLLVTGGVRLDGWQDYDSKLIQTGSTVLGQHPSDRGGMVPTGRLGLRQDLSKSLYLRAAGYAGFRPATLNELHRPFRVGNDVTLANPDLTPERLYGAEVGLGGQGAVTWDADVFYNCLENAVTNVTIGKGPGTFAGAGFVPAGGTLYLRENAGTINAVGIEAEASHSFGAALLARVAVSFTHAQVNGGRQAPQLTGLRPAQTPSTTLTASLDWRPLTPLTLSGALRYESERFDDDQNTRRIDAGAGVDARAQWRFRSGVSAYVAADNLFDGHIQTGRSAANVVTYDSPRVVRIGLTLRR